MIQDITARTNRRILTAMIVSFIICTATVIGQESKQTNATPEEQIPFLDELSGQWMTVKGLRNLPEA